LLRSVDYDVSADQLQFGYNDSVTYGSFLEQGTSKMAKRPNILRVVKANIMRSQNIMDQNIQAEIKNV